MRMGRPGDLEAFGKAKDRYGDGLRLRAVRIIAGAVFGNNGQIAGAVDAVAYLCVDAHILQGSAGFKLGSVGEYQCKTGVALRAPVGEHLNPIAPIIAGSVVMIAHTDVLEVYIQNIGPVTGTVHPAGHDSFQIGISGGNVLAGVAVRHTGLIQGGEAAGAIRAGMAEVLGQFLSTHIIDLLQQGEAGQRFQTFLVALFVDQHQNFPLPVSKGPALFIVGNDRLALGCAAAGAAIDGRIILDGFLSPAMAQSGCQLTAADGADLGFGAGCRSAGRVRQGRRQFSVTDGTDLGCRAGGRRAGSVAVGTFGDIVPAAQRKNAVGAGAPQIQHILVVDVVKSSHVIGGGDTSGAACQQQIPAAVYIGHVGQIALAVDADDVPHMGAAGNTGERVAGDGIAAEVTLVAQIFVGFGVTLADDIGVGITVEGVDHLPGVVAFVEIPCLCRVKVIFHQVADHIAVGCQLLVVAFACVLRHDLTGIGGGTGGCAGDGGIGVIVVLALIIISHMKPEIDGQQIIVAGKIVAVGKTGGLVKPVLRIRQICQKSVQQNTHLLLRRRTAGKDRGILSIRADGDGGVGALAAGHLLEQPADTVVHPAQVAGQLISGLSTHGLILGGVEDTVHIGGKERIVIVFPQIGKAGVLGDRNTDHLRRCFQGSGLPGGGLFRNRLLRRRFFGRRLLGERLFCDGFFRSSLDRGFLCLMGMGRGQGYAGQGQNQCQQQGQPSFHGIRLQINDSLRSLYHRKCGYSRKILPTGEKSGGQVQIIPAREAPQKWVYGPWRAGFAPKDRKCAASGSWC